MSAHRYVIVTSINCIIALINIGSGAAQVTNYLNPSPNLLQFPSRTNLLRLLAVVWNSLMVFIILGRVLPVEEPPKSKCV